MSDTTSTHDASRTECALPADPDWRTLPALPTPDVDAQRRQASGGVAVVVSLIALYVLVTHVAVAVGAAWLRW
eukprot:766046-Prymnesium_polylepis.1